MAKKKASKKRTTKKVEAVQQKQARAEELKSAGHVCFARGTLGYRGSWKAIPAEDVVQGDYEFFVCRYGITLFRAEVRKDNPIKLLRGMTGKGTQRNTLFMKPVRVGHTCIQTGWKLIDNLCEQFRVPMPAASLRLKEAFLDQQHESAIATGATGSAMRSRRSTGVQISASTFKLPEGWSQETKKKSTTGQEYKVYVDPNGKKFYSRKRVQAYLSAQ